MTAAQTLSVKKLKPVASEGTFDGETHRKWVYHYTGRYFHRSLLHGLSAVDGYYCRPTEKPYIALSATAAIARSSTLEVGGLPFS